MQLIDAFIDYVGPVRRRSERTQEIYRSAVSSFFAWYFSGYGSASGKTALDAGKTASAAGNGLMEIPEADMPGILTLKTLRDWRHYLLTEKRYSARTVNQHLSAMSGFCHWLFHREVLQENPFDLMERGGHSAIEGVKLRDEKEKRVTFFSDEALERYLEETRSAADGTLLELYAGEERKEIYDRICRRMIISFLYGTALRRSELISLPLKAVDWNRKVLTVTGKGGKTRQLALTGPLLGELRRYREAVAAMVPSAGNGPEDPFFVTFSGRKLYPVYVDRAVKTELGGREDCPGHKSPHVLRHSLATELLKEGADIYSVGRYLGHSSIAATQIYTHGDIRQLKAVYEKSFPRAGKK